MNLHCRFAVYRNNQTIKFATGGAYSFIYLIENNPADRRVKFAKWSIVYYNAVFVDLK